MQIELNIGLNVTNRDNGQASRNNRAAWALAALHSNFGRRAVSTTEDTLIVQMSVPSEDMAEFQATVQDLAVALEQDCIAVYNATAMSGELIGPRASAWGTFNPDYFIRFDETAGPAVVYAPKAAAKAVAYTGHGAKTGGLQGHSVGSDYPYMIVGVQDRAEAPTRYRVMDTRTSKMSDSYPTQLRAIIEMTALRCRNLMHS
jgi:hypothetical protein